MAPAANLKIRRVEAGDASALERICLLTGDAGQDATPIFPSHGRELLGLLFALPYADPALAAVTTGYVLATADGGVIGYVLSAPDTRAFERLASTAYWPRLRAQYPLPPGADVAARDPWAADDGVWEAEGWPADSTTWSRRVYRLIHTADTSMRAQDAAIAFAPAHLHIDLLPEAQGQGWGTRLIETVADDLRQRGLDGLWVGLDGRNTRARQFYMKIGFKPVAGANENTLGLRFDDLKTTF